VVCEPGVGESGAINYYVTAVMKSVAKVLTAGLVCIRFSFKATEGSYTKTVAFSTIICPDPPEAVKRPSRFP
jgi:hypothetical protein